MQTNLIRPKQAAIKSAISLSHLYALVAQNNYPKPIKISDRITAFVESEVDQWNLERIKKARQSEGK